MNKNNFWVIAVVSNPIRYYSRIELFNRFKKHMADSNVNLIIVEVAFGDRPFEVTTESDPYHVQLRTFDELWHKENMINLGIERLPASWEYVAWIDADIQFVRDDWVEETIHQLQHYMIVQMFSQAHDLGPHYESMQTHEGFMSMYHDNRCHGPDGPGYGGYYQVHGPKTFWHPGYAWAARREAIDQLGGLFDVAILGSADHHMALALIGEVKRTVPHTMAPGYLRELREWERHASFLKRDVGYVQGTINHFWHGKKRDRNYVGRWDVLTKNHYNPDTDIKRDWQGLWQLVVENTRQRRLRDDIRFYMRSRNEDSTEC